MNEPTSTTTGALDSVSAATLTPIAHRIELLFGFKFDDYKVKYRSINERLSSMKIKQVAREESVHPTRLVAEASRPIGEQPVWEFVNFDVSCDLHPFVQNIFNSGLDDSDRTNCYRLSSYGINMLNGKYRRPFGFVTGGLNAISGLSIDGTFNCEPFRLLVAGVNVHLFQTQFGVAVISMQVVTEDVCGPNTNLLVELSQRLCEERSTGHLSWAEAEAEHSVKRFTAAALIEPLLEAAACTLVPRKRTYSFCAMSFDEALPQADAHDLAFRLSRHYNSRYRPAADLVGTKFVQPFETVLHALSREGACTIVTHIASDGAPVEFLKTWLTQSHALVYLPLQIAAFHEHTVLLDLAQGSGMHIDLKRDNEIEARLLRNLCGRFLVFRLRYRLSQISSLTTHDLVYEATRDALGLTALSEKISRDMLAVERRLKELSDERHAKEEALRNTTLRLLERKFSGVITFAGAGLTYLTLIAVSEKLLDLLFTVHPGPHYYVEVGRQCVAIFAAVAIGYYNWKHQRLSTAKIDKDKNENDEDDFDPVNEVPDHEGIHMMLEAVETPSSLEIHDRAARGT